MEKCTFEVIREEHIDTLRNIYIHYVNYSTATFHKREISKDEMRNLLIFSNPKYEGYVIKYNDEICGYVVLTQYKPREAFDHTAEVTIYLKSGQEGRGIGNKALGFIEDRARTKDLHTLIGLICGENTASIALFEKHGYKKCAHYKEVGYKFDRWLDLVCYQKMINSLQ
ncbi:MAG: GCN5-related N-acetyltransferase [Clostridia bacterium]|jgi:phosphinothricin acetyltransferase|nr:GCN5-related N-acetyltransferase [Clostridia bacterium]